MRLAFAVLATSLVAASSASPKCQREVEACRLSGLAAIKERSPSLDQITLDMESLAVSKANTKVGDTPITMVVMGDAYLQRDKTDKPNRFVCLLSDNDKVVLTFFTEQ